MRGTGPCEEAADLVYGLHPVEEALAARPSEIERIFTSREAAGRLGRLLRSAREQGVPVSYLPRAVLGRKLGARAAHQGIAARIAPFAYRDARFLCQSLADAAAARIVVLDGVNDPQNLGSALRTCAAAGVDAVLLAADATVGLTAAVAKASAGAIERVAVAREAKLPARLRWLAERGFETIGLVAEAGEPWDRVGWGGRIAVVAGAEARGLRPGVRRACRRQVRIPLAGGLDSLNVAVALGVVLFEAVRQARCASEPC